MFLDRRGLLATALVLGSVLELVSLASLAVLPPEFQAFGQGLAKVLSNGALWPAVARLVPVSRFGCAFSVIVLARKCSVQPFRAFFRSCGRRGP